MVAEGVNLAVQIALIASVFIVAAGVLGVSLANARNAQKTQVDSLYERENDALNKALARSEREVQRLQTELEKASDKVRILEGTVSGAEEVKRLRVELTAVELRRREDYEAMMVLLKDVIAQWRNKRGEIGR